MKIIMLTGGSNTGKTTTINLVAGELLTQGAILITGTIKTGNTDGQYRLQYKELNIGIVTSGDRGREVIYNIGYYRGVGVDVLIIANSNKKNAKEIAKEKGSPFHKVNKKSADDTDNNRAKEEILKYIEQ
jgi:predicted ABC-type transport system involved in lysophospholipase L1 biosynthesis ATPase subunit